MAVVPWILSDALWGADRAAPVEEGASFPSSGCKRLDDRSALQGILVVPHTGIAWRHQPPELGFGSGSTCYRRLDEAVLKLASQGSRRLDDPARGRRDRTAPAKPGPRRQERALDRGGAQPRIVPSGATPGRFHPDAGTPPAILCATVGASTGRRVSWTDYTDCVTVDSAVRASRATSSSVLPPRDRVVVGDRRDDTGV
jgi:transposase